MSTVLSPIAVDYPGPDGKPRCAVHALRHVRAREAEWYLRVAAALLLLAALASGCKAFVAEPAYQPTPLPANVTELYRVFGDAGGDTVWVYEQGGPVHMLEDDPLRQFRHYPRSRRSAVRPGAPDSYHQ